MSVSQSGEFPGARGWPKLVKLSFFYIQIENAANGCTCCPQTRSCQNEWDAHIGTKPPLKRGLRPVNGCNRESKLAVITWNPSVYMFVDQMFIKLLGMYRSMYFCDAAHTRFR